MFTNCEIKKCLWNIYFLFLRSCEISTWACQDRKGKKRISGLENLPKIIRGSLREKSTWPCPIYVHSDHRVMRLLAMTSGLEFYFSLGQGIAANARAPPPPLPTPPSSSHRYGPIHIQDFHVSFSRTFPELVLLFFFGVFVLVYFWTFHFMFFPFSFFVLILLSLLSFFLFAF